MGDRYILTLTCPYCNQLNDDVYYAKSSGAMDHRCEKCGKVFDIGMQFVAIARKEKKDI